MASDWHMALGQLSLDVLTLKDNVGTIARSHAEVKQVVDAELAPTFVELRKELEALTSRREAEHRMILESVDVKMKQEFENHGQRLERLTAMLETIGLSDEVATACARKSDSAPGWRQELMALEERLVQEFTTRQACLESSVVVGLLKLSESFGEEDEGRFPEVARDTRVMALSVELRQEIANVSSEQRMAGVSLSLLLDEQREQIEAAQARAGDARSRAERETTARLAALDTRCSSLEVSSRAGTDSVLHREPSEVTLGKANSPRDELDHSQALNTLEVRLRLELEDQRLNFERRLTEQATEMDLRFAAETSRFDEKRVELHTIIQMLEESLQDLLSRGMHWKFADGQEGAKQSAGGANPVEEKLQPELKREIGSLKHFTEQMAQETRALQTDMKNLQSVVSEKGMCLDKQSRVQPYCGDVQFQTVVQLSDGASKVFKTGGMTVEAHAEPSRQQPQQVARMREEQHSAARSLSHRSRCVSPPCPSADKQSPATTPRDLSPGRKRSQPALWSAHVPGNSTPRAPAEVLPMGSAGTLSIPVNAGSLNVSASEGVFLAAPARGPNMPALNFARLVQDPPGSTLPFGKGPEMSLQQRLMSPGASRPGTAMDSGSCLPPGGAAIQARSFPLGGIASPVSARRSRPTPQPSPRQPVMCQSSAASHAPPSGRS